MTRYHISAPAHGTILPAEREARTFVEAIRVASTLLTEGHPFVEIVDSEKAHNIGGYYKIERSALVDEIAGLEIC